MGMAASQARFLQLTARRSNIEYQGQQINQERLSLANASAGLFEKMLTLVPPTPPSSQDDKYYKQGYNFTDPTDELQKKISWTTLQDSNVAGTTKAFGINYNYYSAGAVSEANITSLGYTGAEYPAGTALVGAVPGPSDYPVTVAGRTANSGILDVTYDDLENMSGSQALNTLGLTPVANSSVQVVRYVTIEHNVYDPDGNYKPVTESAPAVLEFDNLNRLLNVTLLNAADNMNGAFSGTGSASSITPKGGDPDTAIIADGANGTAPTDLTTLTSVTATPKEEIGQGESLTYSAVFDDQSFQNDMNKYEFQKASYDYQIERINQQTSRIQTQDKSLELKMKQLDTEHNAVQTEMEAVQKVIQKNVESTFKTFA